MAEAIKQVGVQKPARNFFKLTNSQRDESTAVRVLDSFKLLSDPEITEEALKAGPGPLPTRDRPPATR